MEFYSESFPNQKVEIALYSISNGQTGCIPELLEIQNEHAGNLAIVNANLVASLMHLNIGLSRALINKRDHETQEEQIRTNQISKKEKTYFKTKNLPQELLYHLSPGGNINNAVDQFGIKHIEKAFFVLMINFPEDLR